MPLRNALSIRQIRETGFNAGWNAASWVDMPEIGQTLSLDIDFVGIGTIRKGKETETAPESLFGYPVAEFMAMQHKE